MGRSIRAHVEVKLNGRWEHYSHPQYPLCYGDYDVFDLLASQGEGRADSIAADRGLPEDITEVTRFDFFVKWGADAHSPSWISADEVGILTERYRAEGGGPPRHSSLRVFSSDDYFGYLFGNCIETREDWPEGVEDARVVFWFDN
jgi:hypothetical protein